MQWRVKWLLVQGIVVEIITENTETEYHHGQSIATVIWRTKDFSQEVGVVLCTSSALQEVSFHRRYHTLTSNDARQSQSLFHCTGPLTHFQKIGLKAMEAAETFSSVSIWNSFLGNFAFLISAYCTVMLARDRGNRSFARLWRLQ